MRPRVCYSRCYWRAETLRWVSFLLFFPSLLFIPPKISTHLARENAWAFFFFCRQVTSYAITRHAVNAWGHFLVSARTAFEKLTDYDYRGTTYYSVRNLSLYECQGWCREEPECQAAAFSFVVNPLAPMQDTLCQLQNETAATNPAAQPQRAANMYYMTKLQIRSGEQTQGSLRQFHFSFYLQCLTDIR